MGLLNLIGRISLDGAPFKQGLDKSKKDAQSAASDISNSLKGALVGALGGFTIAAQFKEAADYAAKIVDLSGRTGIGTGALQEISFGASMAGSSLDALLPILQRITVAKKEALKDPNGDFADAFLSLGISVEDLKSKRIEDLFYRIGDAVESAGDSQAIFADVLKITGKSGGEMVQVFKGGFSEAIDQFKKLDIAVSDEKLRNIEAYGDRFTSLGFKIKSAFMEAVSGVASAHTSAGNFLSTLGSEVDLLMRFAIGGTKDKLSWEEFKMERDALYAGQNEGVFGRDKGTGFGGGPSLKSVMGGVAFEDGSNKEIAGIIKMHERINELKFSALDDEGKRVELLKQIEEYEMRIALIRAGRFLGIGGTPKDILQQELNIAEAKAKLEGLRKASVKEDRGMSPIKDSLTSIGNFLGANPNSGQMKEFSEMNRQLKAIERNTSRVNGGGFPL